MTRHSFSCTRLCILTLTEIIQQFRTVSQSDHSILASTFAQDQTQKFSYFFFIFLISQVCVRMSLWEPMTSCEGWVGDAGTLWAARRPNALQPQKNHKQLMSNIIQEYVMNVLHWHSRNSQQERLVLRISREIYLFITANCIFVFMEEFKCLNVLYQCDHGGRTFAKLSFYFHSLIINDILFYELFHNKLNIN